MCAELESLSMVTEISTAQQWLKDFKLYFSASQCLVFGNSLRIKNKLYAVQENILIKWLDYFSVTFSSSFGSALIRLAHRVHLGKGLLVYPLEKSSPSSCHSLFVFIAPMTPSNCLCLSLPLECKLQRTEVGAHSLWNHHCLQLYLDIW